MLIAITGNIGSGKTSLTEIVAKRMNFQPLFEDSDNPYIDDFYDDMNRWSFNLQIYFLGQRLRQSIAIQNSGKDIVQDRTIFEDAYIFATNLHEAGLMSSRDYEAYMQVFELSYGLVRNPDLLIYLKASVPTLISQIQKRGRLYEMSIQSDYLQRLNDKYENWINNIYKGKVLVIDVDKSDFILNPEKIDSIMDLIKSEIGR